MSNDIQSARGTAGIRELNAQEAVSQSGEAKFMGRTVSVVANSERKLNKSNSKLTLSEMLSQLGKLEQCQKILEPEERSHSVRQLYGKQARVIHAK